MAVAHSAASESHTGTTGSTNQAAFTWTHTQTGTPQGVVVFVHTISATDTVTSVTYGGTGLTRVTGGAAIDNAGEPGRTDLFFLGSGLATGNQTITVNRTNNATVMYASAATVTAGANTAIPGTPVLLQGDGTLTQQNVDDTSPGQNSVRYAAAYYGGAAPPVVGANSTLLTSIDFGQFAAAMCRETTAGQGSRPVGFADASDDRAAVHIAIRELVPRTETPFLGTFTLTGQPNTIARGRVMTGERGAFTFTGNAADARHNPRETPIVGVFTLTGQPNTLGHNPKIDGGRGAFTLTGNPVTLAKASPPKVITADRGIFTLTGNPAILQQAYALASGTGAFNLTGNPAGLALAWRLDATAGSFTLTGNPVTLTQFAASKLLPVVGTFTLASNGATLSRSRLFAADRGQFTLTGNAADARHNVRITGDRGAFALTGNLAALTEVGAFEIDPIVGTFALAGNGATLSRSRLFAADRGQFTLSGQQATLRQIWRVAGDRGQFTLLGQPATIRFAHSMLGARGIFTLNGNPAGLADTDRIDAEKGTYILTGLSVLLSKTGDRRRNVLIF